MRGPCYAKPLRQCSASVHSRHAIVNGMKILVIDGYGGHRGPDLTGVGDRFSSDQTLIRIMNGGTNMPAFGSTLSSQELDYLVTFLASRKSQHAD